MTRKSRCLKTLSIICASVTLALAYYVTILRPADTRTAFLLVPDFHPSVPGGTFSITPNPLRKPLMYAGRIISQMRNQSPVIDAIINRVASDAQSLENGPNTTDPVGVLILTYMRSGSSLTGEILQHAQDTVYLFEPFKSLYNNLQGKPVSFLNGTVSQPRQYRLSHIHKQALIGWLTCNVDLIYKESFFDEFMGFGVKTKTLSKCINHTRKTKAEIHRCVNNFRALCLNSTFRIVKTIRTPLQLALSVMNQVQNMKIIHLIRDPRATVKSQVPRGVCPVKTGGAAGCAWRHCEKVMEDTRIKNKSKFKKHNILTVKYEDIAQHPVETTMQMYKFIGLQFTDSVKTFVRDVTLGGNRRECAVCQLKWQMGKKSDNSTQHVDSWKNANPNMISVVQKKCKAVLDYYKYEMFNGPPRNNR